MRYAVLMAMCGVLLLPNTSKAYFCWNYDQVGKEYEAADVVFAGEVVSVQENGMGELDTPRIDVMFQVNKVWKGVKEEVGYLTLDTEEKYDYDFRKGDQYLVYGYKLYDDRISMVGCPRIKPLYEVSEVLKEIGDPDFIVPVSLHDRTEKEIEEKIEAEEAQEKAIENIPAEEEAEAEEEPNQEPVQEVVASDEEERDADQIERELLEVISAIDEEEEMETLIEGMEVKAPEVPEIPAEVKEQEAEESELPEDSNVPETAEEPAEGFENAPIIEEHLGEALPEEALKE